MRPCLGAGTYSQDTKLSHYSQDTKLNHYSQDTKLNHYSQDTKLSHYYQDTKLNHYRFKQQRLKKSRRSQTLCLVLAGINLFFSEIFFDEAQNKIKK